MLPDFLIGSNIAKQEKILVLPYNTLRIVDVMLQIEIEKAKNPKWAEPLDKVIAKVTARKIKDMGKWNNVDSDIVHDLLKINFSKYYDLAPRTNIYPLLGILKNQKFISSIIVLSEDKNIYEEDFINEYYDGSIDKLETFISENGITAIFMDDIELLKTLVDRKKIDMTGMSIFISRMGYNFYSPDGSILLMKYMQDIPKKANIEIACINLLNFEHNPLK